MAGIKEQVGIQIKLNGQEIQSSENMFDTVEVVRNPRYAVPFMRIALNDTSGKLHSGPNQIAEGTKIQARFYRFSEEENTPFMDFRAGVRLPSSRVPDGTSPEHWLCFLDAPAYYAKVEQMGVKGTSAEAIAKIAAKVGLKAKCDNTADMMKWLNYNRTLFGYARDIVYHGYANSSSAMMLGCETDKTLLYRDVVACLAKKPVLRIIVGTALGSTFERLLESYGISDGSKQTVGSDGVREVFAYDTRPHSTSAQANSLINYGFKVYTDVAGSMATADKYKVKKTMPNIHMNPELKSIVGTARVDHKPMNYGNTHKRYEQAVHQNARGLALFTEHLSVMVNTMTNAKLFDTVEVRMVESPGKQDSMYESGVYVVVAAGQTMPHGKNYVEKLLLVRNGSKALGSTPML